MHLSKENKLLLYCTSKEIPEARRHEVISLIRSSLYWDEILESAYWHGIAPLLYHSLKGLVNDAIIPLEVMNELKDTYHQNLARNMYFYAELKQILKAFNESGIKVIVLKGAGLAETVYGDIALRPMNDIDLMIRKEDLPTAEKVMTNIGYMFDGNEERDWYKKNHYHMSYLNPDRKILVEIHWHIGTKSQPSRIALTDSDIIQGWWARSQNVEIAGVPALMLSPEDLVFHLALHFLKHRFNGVRYKGQFTSKNALIQLCDIKLILEQQKDEINWTRLKLETDKYGVTSLVYSTLYIADELLCNGELRSYLTSNEYMAEDLGRELVELVRKKILVKEDDIPTGFFQSLAADSSRDRLGILLNSIFPQSKVLANRYSLDASSPKLFFYYLIHPFSILLRHGNLLWNLVSPNKEIKREVILNKWINSKNQNV